MSTVIRTLYQAGLRSTVGDADFALAFYIADPGRVLCQVAVDAAGDISGFQSLKRAEEGNRYGTPVGWGIIGTHIDPRAGRQGIGTAFFEKTRSAAILNRLPFIEAGIGSTNPGGLAFYEAMGFRTYREGEGITYKSYEVPNSL
jgi:GNAT superfamily N-acetyltransferase